MRAVLRSAVHGHEGFADDPRRQVRRPLPRRHGSRRFHHSRRPEDQHQGHRVRGKTPSDAASPNPLAPKRPRNEPQPVQYAAGIHTRVRRHAARSIRCPHWRRRVSAKFRACRCRFASCSSRCCATATARRSREAHVKELANWGPTAARVDEIPFVVARVVLQDFTGVPLLADLAAMRNVANDLGKNPKTIEPLVPVDLVVDHSVMIDHYGTKDALDLNMKLEFERNNERYQFMKWGMQAFATFGVVPPGIGIVHQVNLEYLARGVYQKDGLYYPDSLVGTDSHTTMVNGVGVVAWGVGGIEAEAGMLGQPVYFLTPGRGRRRAQGQALRKASPPPTSCSPSPRCCARRRWSASSSSSSAKARRRCRCPTARRSATWRRSTARPWAFSRSTRRPSTTSRPRAAPAPRSMRSPRTSRRRACSASRARARSTTRRW